MLLPWILPLLSTCVKRLERSFEKIIGKEITDLLVIAPSYVPKVHNVNINYNSISNSRYAHHIPVYQAALKPHSLHHL